MDTEGMHGSAEVIDADGDVILVVGSTDTVKLRVSSRYLSKVSSVFLAMFSGKFAEGLGLSTTTPKEVKLSDDDAVPMRILCNIAHLRFNNVPTKLDVDDIVKVARTADKYDCAPLCRFFSLSWLSQTRDSLYFEETIQLVGATFLFEDPDWFRTLTKRLVVDHAWSFSKLHTALLSTDVIPIEVTILLESQRESSLETLYQKLDDIKKHTCISGGYCEYWNAVRPLVVERLQTSQANQLPCRGISGLSVNSACFVLLCLDPFQMCQGLHRCKVEHPLESFEALVAFIDGIKEACHGICLRCIRQGSDAADTCDGHEEQ